MDLIQQLKDKVKGANKRIALPEATDARVLQAAVQITKEGFAVPVLVGDEAAIKAAATKEGVNIDGIEIISPENFDRFQEGVDTFVELRAKKGMTPEKATQTLHNDLFLGAMLVRLGVCDGMVAGSASPTASVLRAALQIIGTKKGSKTVSACFFMFTKTPQYGDDGVMVFADCGVIPNPTSEQLSDIAVSSVDKARKVLGYTDPRVAFLSFSTKGSASSPEVDKVIEAVNITKERGVDFEFDGEMQLDAAIEPVVAAKKAPDSKVAGKANVVIFPDLGAANIGYKLVQRFGGATALGPLIQGLAAPVHDLSRGCSAQDIVDIAAIAAVEALDA